MAENNISSSKAHAAVIADHQVDVLLEAIKGVVGTIYIDPFFVSWLREKLVLQKDRIHLAEHHIYGSSRLGMQKYLPSALSYDAMAVAGPGTYQTLLQQKPWYSRYGANLFNYSVVSSATLGTAQMGTAGLRPTSHILGQRHYELVNHLGNVLIYFLIRMSFKVLCLSVSYLLPCGR